MADGIVSVPKPVNESVRDYAPCTRERESLKARLGQLLEDEVEIPLIIGGKEVRTGRTTQAVCPHSHRHVLAVYHQAGPAEVEHAVAAALEAWKTWSETDWGTRAAVFLKAAQLLAGPWRDTVNAACVLNQSKTAYQAEIDAACELIDFWRFNPHFMRFIYEQQPESAAGTWNYADYRPLEGFVFAVTPFNFASIAGNLPTAPAMMGNVVLWKPASSAVYTAYHIMKLLQAAGLPDGVINFVPGPGSHVGDVVLRSPHLAGLHFTGSTATLQAMWRTIGGHIDRYRAYPRIVGETGGKDFVFVHASANIPAVVTALVRGAYEYQGQKCSAASRAYIPRSAWPRVKDELLSRVAEIRVGSPLDFRNFMAAVIDNPAFQRIMDYIDFGRSTPDTQILAGGVGDDSEGYFVQPTVALTTNPTSRLMVEEIFGPFLTIYVYEDSRLDETLALCDAASPYGLTGAIFAEDRQVIGKMTAALRHAAGNFYVNDKPTGAVVGQQPFGGSRASGTNDKAGSYLNLIRWISQRAIKENFVPPTHFEYPFMGEE